ncbi:MAG TPA: formate dehydrogenase accessory protein FdhE [Planctomycetota bacterium]|nr:formate dehydrogenase accessory protein FdhE [Planctomycetota bacterium]
MPAEWSHGHCAVCAAWPALVELRGPERERRLRCSRCGADWAAAPPMCPFCECADADRLSVMVVGPGEAARHVEVCRDCGSYVKRVTTATAIRPGDVAVRDLLTLDLDLAALDAGLARPGVRALRSDVDPIVRRPGGLVASLPGA